MAILKCKMCGGQLDVSEGMTVCECEYCGTKQTLPKINNDQILNMIGRANHFRQQCEFDKALEIYEKVLNLDDSDPEIYWSLVLCRYGIEYVDDPLTKTKIPTCHRAQYKSILDDSDYLAALEHADSLQREIYKKEAEYIHSVQKGILEISNKEEPFDIFICYKESDENGKRTPDSVLAQDLYYQLTQEGFKVFFSRITLEDKLGSAYEPYIFAALNSAKVMVVVGTKAEYFNAVWVKNEWSRYLQIMQNDSSKAIIPAYKDMDPYDLPDALSMFQAQDMSKLGFMQDLLRGIKKITQQEEHKQTVVHETVIQNENHAIDPLLKRIKLFLEDGEWDSANEYCNRVLDNDPECAQAYFYMLMSKLNMRTEQEFEQQKIQEGIAGEEYFKKAYRFGDESFKARLDELNDKCIHNYLQKVYDDALKELNNARTVEACTIAENKFRSLNGFSDSEQKILECKEKTKLLQKEKTYKDAIFSFRRDTIEDINEALRIFKNICNYKDSSEWIDKCNKRIEELLAAEEQRIEEEKRLHELQMKEKKRRERKAIKITAISLVSIAIIFAGVFAYKEISYKNAVQTYDNGDYDSAIQKFEKLGDYKDSQDKIIEINTEISYEDAVQTYENGDYDSAIQKFEQLGDYKDSQDKIIEINYEVAVKTYEDGDYDSAIQKFEQLGDYKDSQDKLKNSQDKLKKNLEKVRLSLPKDTIAVGYDYTVGLRADGTVVATGKNDDGQCNVSDWKDIVAVSAGSSHTVGLRSDGTVVATGCNWSGQCDVSGWKWKDIVAVSAGAPHTVGLRADGTVVATGKNDDGKYNVSDWKNIVAVSAGSYHTVGLRADGTVVATGENDDGECDVSDWKDIVAVSAGNSHTVGLRADGTVVATGENDDGECNVSGWKDIVAVSAGGSHTVGLRADGTVVATGSNKDRQCNVYWHDIVAISAEDYKTVGLRLDGTLESTQFYSEDERNLKDIQTK